MEAFDRHWRGAPIIPRIVFKPVPEPFTRAAALRNGEVDLITTVPPSLAKSWSGAGATVHRVPSTWQIYLGLNAFRKPLSDVRVRQALNYASDVDTIVRTVLEGNGRRQDGPFTSSMLGYDASVKGYRHDPQKARQLLSEAGYPDGLEITLESPTGRYQGDKEIAEALGGQWQKAGFKPKVQVAEWGAYFKRYLGKQFQDAYVLGLGGPMQDGDELYNLVSSKGRGLYYATTRSTRSSTWAAAPWTPPRGGRSTPISRRTMVEDATWVFLMQQVDIYAARDRLGWTPRADQWMSFTHRDAEVAAAPSPAARGRSNLRCPFHVREAPPAPPGRGAWGVWGATGAPTSLDGNVPEQGGAELQHALHVLAERARHHELPPRHVQAPRRRPGPAPCRRSPCAWRHPARARNPPAASRSARWWASRTTTSRRAPPSDDDTAGVIVSNDVDHVWKMFQPPWAGGSFLARRALSVPQSIACRSTLMPICFSFSAVTSACACAYGASAGSRITIGSPL